MITQTPPENVTGREPQVLILTSAEDISGGEVFLMSLVGGLTKWKSYVATPNPILAERCQKLGAGSTVIPEFLPLRRSNVALALYRLFIMQPRALWKLWRLVRLVRPNLIMAGAFSEAHFAFILSKLFRVPALWSHQHPVFETESRDRKLAAWLVTKGQMHAVGCSNTVAHSLGVTGSSAERVSSIANSIDVFRFGRRKQDSRKGRPVVVGLVAMITPWKGHRLLIEATHILKNRGFGAGVFIVDFYGGVYGRRVADAAHQTNLETMIERLSVGDQVRFCGKRENMRDVYENLDIVVNASLEPEPLGISILEAMSMECIAIVPNEGGPGEIVSDGVDGFTYEPRSANSLADKLQSAIENIDSLNELRASGRRTVQSRFSVEKMALGYEDLFLKLTEIPTSSRNNRAL